MYQHQDFYIKCINYFIHATNVCLARGYTNQHFPSENILLPRHPLVDQTKTTANTYKPLFYQNLHISKFYSLQRHLQSYLAIASKQGHSVTGYSHLACGNQQMHTRCYFPYMTCIYVWVSGKGQPITATCSLNSLLYLNLNFLTNL